MFTFIDNKTTIKINIMNKFHILILLILSVSFSYSQDIIKNKNWYNGSVAFVLGLDENKPIGFKAGGKNLYFEFKSNFGLYAKDVPSGYDRDFDDYDFVVNTMEAIYQGRIIDETSSVFFLNFGYNQPLLKTNAFTLSVFGGPGLYMSNKKNYDVYYEEILDDLYYVTSNHFKGELNINAGVEFMFQAFGILISYDNKSKFYTAGISIPILPDFTVEDNQKPKR